ncbi:Vacuolar protein sorting-associated protein 52 [Rhizina undulata]
MWRPNNWSGSPTQGVSPVATPPPSQPQSRSYSPSPLSNGTGPRRSRPSLSHRPSSISLASSTNTSTTSLPGAVRPQQNGYRRVVSGVPPAGVRDPLDVLENILGTQIKDLVDESEEEDEKVVVEVLQEEIDFGGLSLEDWVRREEELEKNQGEVELRVREFGAQSVEEYEKEKDKFQDLHRSIKACDEVLESVESYLSSFQDDLGVVSAEIETLQNRSTALNQKLENRKNVEKLLGPIVEDVAISPRIIKRLVEGDVNETWVKALQEADRKMKAVELRDPAKVKAVQDVRPELERLTHKAIERVRDFFVQKIKSIRIPGANAQMIQQNGFLRYKELFQFMASHHEQLAEEITQAYINTMRWYYLSHFQRYHKILEKSKMHVMDKNDTLGMEEPARRNNLLQSFKSAPTLIHDPYNLGRRIDTLKNRTAPILTAQQAEEDKTTHYPETPFRHFNAALVENASAEYSFVSEFFTHKSYDQVSQIFHQIFDPTFNIGKTFTKNLIDSTLDSLGVLLCVRLNQYSAFELQRRRIPVADSYINATNMLLWPRFQIVMDAHCESLRRAAMVAGGSRTALGLASAVDPSKMSVAPHALTQKFAAFVCGILMLSAEAGDDEPVANSLGRLRNEFEAFLTKISGAGGSGDAGRRRERFLGNNYSLVLTIISDTEGKLASEQKMHFEALKKAFGG